jgi:hypothetical protein
LGLFIVKDGLVGVRSGVEPFRLTDDTPAAANENGETAGTGVPVRDLSLEIMVCWP